MPHLLKLIVPDSHMLAIGLPGGWEWIVLLVLGLLIFGRRLPEVGRSIGRSIVEFKKGIKGIEEEIEAEAAAPSKSSSKELPNSNASQARVERNEPVGVESGTRED